VADRGRRRCPVDLFVPGSEEAATSVQLKDAFTKHLAETEVHVARLEQVFHLAPRSLFCLHRKEPVMNRIVYIVGLVVIVIAVLSFFGLR
jgi:hypothetical protein